MKKSLMLSALALCSAMFIQVSALFEDVVQEAIAEQYIKNPSNTFATIKSETFEITNMDCPSLIKHDLFKELLPNFKESDRDSLKLLLLNQKYDKSFDEISQNAAKEFAPFFNDSGLDAQERSKLTEAYIILAKRFSERLTKCMQEKHI